MWAFGGVAWIGLAAAGWFLLIMGGPILAQLWQLPKTKPATEMRGLTEASGVAPFELEAMRPRASVVLEALIVVAAVATLVLLPEEWNPGRRGMPMAHETLFIALMIAFVAYQLVAHAVALYRLVQRIWWEQHLAKSAMRATGQITDSSGGWIRYEFLDYSSQLQRGQGRDYSLSLYEEMPVTVLYDAEQPEVNLPLVGLQFHRPRATVA